MSNVCGHRVWLQEGFYIGWSLYPDLVASNGSVVELEYGLLDGDPRYSWFGPDDPMVETVDIAGMAHSIEIDDEDHDFDWDMPGPYEISFGYWGARTTLEVRSNTLTFKIEG